MDKGQDTINNWTHVNVTIKEIKANSLFYMFTIDVPEDSELNGVILKVKKEIFEKRLQRSLIHNSYKDITSITWDMVITKGKFIKLEGRNLVVVDKSKNSNDWYVSFLDKHSEDFKFEHALDIYE